jgi:signal transduction histidine kinase
MGNELQAFIDSLEDGVVLIGRDLLVRQLNEAIRAKFCLGDRQVVGRPCCEVLPCRQDPPCDQANDCPARQVFATGRSNRVVHSCRVNDQPVWIDIVASPLSNDRGDLDRVVEIWRDISDQKQLEEGYERRVRELSALHLISATSSQSLSIQEILNRALDQVVEVLQVEAGGVYLLDETSKVLRLRAYRSMSSEVAQDIDYLRLGEGFSGKVVETGQPLIIDDVRTDPRLTRQMLNQEDLRSLLSVPLRSKAGATGTLWVATRSPARRFLESERDWLAAVGGQVGLALENARLYSEVQRREEERTQLLAHVIDAQEQERKRVARGLHDEISQTLTAVAVAADSLLASLPLENEELVVRIKRLKAGIWEIIDGVHQVIVELRPSVLDDLGLIPALRWYTSSKLEPVGVRATFDFAELYLGLSSEQETGLFRVFQEAINNVAQHARAHTVRVSLARTSGAVLVTVADDGTGFDPNETMDLRASPRGLGLLGMRERLNLMGGKLDVETSLGHGTRLRIRLPLVSESRG